MTVIIWYSISKDPLLTFTYAYILRVDDEVISRIKGVKNTKIRDKLKVKTKTTHILLLPSTKPFNWVA